jgi:murein DD-endopeptidase MepM/ murein hydrolase activator NlpD
MAIAVNQMHSSAKSPRFFVGLFMCIILLAVSVSLSSEVLLIGSQARSELPLADNMETFCAFSVDTSRLYGTGSWERYQYRLLAAAFLYSGGNVSSDSRFWLYRKFLRKELLADYEDAFYTVLSDGIYFPVAKDVEHGETVSYEDSWADSRNYGGKRHHEGTDLMPSVTERGYFPVVSVSDGVIEKKGWLKLGGYRLGIRAEHGAYYYYAHLDHYAENIEENKKIQAGTVIGYMGDSGYGEEGTVGQFATHLHFGIYLTIDGKETAVNPYHILQALERNQVAK